MKDLQDEVMQYLKERNWHNLRPGDIAKSVSIEAAELLELFQWTNPTRAAAKKDKANLKKIRLELADVLIYCLEMASLLGLDAREVVKEKLELAREKYPAEKFRRTWGKKGRSGLDLYIRIRDEHRRKK